MAALTPAAATDNGHRRHILEVREVVWLSEITFLMVLSQPQNFSFDPGQWIRFYHNDLTFDYTLLNAPGVGRLEILVRHFPGGRFSPVLAHAKPGDRFQISGPHGYFVFEPSNNPAVFVATGTGLAPFVAMARVVEPGELLLHGVTHAAELYYAHLMRNWIQTYVPCISRGQAAVPGAYKGRVTGYLKDHLAAGIYDFYLCGTSAMIRDITLLVDERFEGSRVFTEAFN